ncbi:MAG TPA: cell envelope integrity protein TolA [Planctomycetota bacterium]|nr:cell envelope integrity protein TolA [Planctomycetota bacterium]
MASSTFDSLFGGGIDPQLKRMVALSALAHVTLGLLAFLTLRSGPLPVDYTPAISVALVDLPEVTDLKDVKLGAPKPKQLPAPQPKKELREAAQAKKIPEPQKKVFALEEEKKTAKRATESKSTKRENLQAKLESAVDRIRRQQMAIARIRNRVPDTAMPEGTPGGSVRGTGALRVGYEAQIVMILRDMWELPPSFLGQNLETVVLMQINPQGQIVDWRIQQSSGNPAFDDSVYRAMTKTQQRQDLPVPDPAAYQLIKDGYEVRFNPLTFFQGETG